EASSAARSALQAAIDAAQAIADDATHQTQVQLDAAVTALQSAVETFEDAIVVAGDGRNLVAALTNAKQGLTDHPAGTNVGEASSAARSALQAAIDAAQAIADDATQQTQSQLDAAVTALQAAVETFEDAIVVAGDGGNLSAALAKAKQELTEHPAGDNVGEASVASCSALQAAIDAAQAIADTATQQTQSQLDAATVMLNDALIRFESAWVNLVLAEPADGLYGIRDALRFSVSYAYEVTVSGTPAIPFKIGTVDAEQTVYAVYTGARGTPLTELTFEYEVPEGFADADGIEIAPQLDLPAGAGIVRADGSAAPLAFRAPNADGLRVVSVPPALSLTAGAGGRTTEVTAAASVFGASAGNALVKLAWLPGRHAVADFAVDPGADILTARQFTVVANGDYTVYAQDSAGNEAVKELVVTNIASPSTGPIDYSGSADPDPFGAAEITINGIRTPVRGMKEISADGQTVFKFILSPEQAAEAFARDQQTGVVAVDAPGQAVVVSMPAASLLLAIEGRPDAQLQVIVNGNGMRIPLADIGQLAEGAMLNVTIAPAFGDADAALQKAAKQEGASLLLPHPIAHGLNIDGQAIDDRNGGYPVRTLLLPTDAEPSEATAVWIDAKGGLHFAPSVFSGDGSRTVAITAGAGSSIYAVIHSAHAFADTQGHWAQKEIELLANKRIVEGSPNGGFKPNEAITRAEFAALLVRALGLSEAIDAKAFADVDADDWYAGAVGAARHAGLIDGYGDGDFRPNAGITREQMAVMIARAMVFAGQSPARSAAALEPFADGGDIAEWAADAAASLVGAGIIQGATAASFDPRAQATRAQSAVLLTRMLQALRYINS
ncbi:S-layer homology domain-containing protein, partial [Paenibacillus glycinis]